MSNVEWDRRDGRDGRDKKDERDGKEILKLKAKGTAKHDHS
jgi:hypothetical protein